MYGLKQAAILAYKQLVDHIKKYDYEPKMGTACIFKHCTRRTKFCLCVDDFGVKYCNNDDFQHFLNALKLKQKVTTDLEGEYFCGLIFKWIYEDGYIDMSMLGYVEKALDKLQNKPDRVP